MRVFTVSNVLAARKSGQAVACCQFKGEIRARIQYDIDTMRNGPLLFDLIIIGKTLAVAWHDQHAY